MDSGDAYDLLALCEGFQWDAGNASKGLARHNVEPGECEQAFFQEPFVATFDQGHSETEQRWRGLGQTIAGRKLYLVFTIRGALIRVIVARDMNRKERKRYEEVQASLEEDPGL